VSPGYTLARERAHAQRDLADPDAWCLIAEDDGHAGQIAFGPAAKSGRPVDDPKLAHLRNLFVRPDRWGSGIAKDLHDAAIHEARRRGYEEMRLFAAAGQARARRFYEREGWVQAGEPAFDPRPGLEMVEYRLRLD
jgi:GNAT superfamily N-acetyltransferase